MVLKEAPKLALAGALNMETTDLQELLLLSGWPKSLIDEFLLKTRQKFHSLEVRPESALVLFDAISKKFGDKSILENVSLRIVPGELLGIIGLSGAGKTTLLNLMVGFSTPDSGKVSLKLPDGSITSIDKDSNLIKTMFGFAAQTPSFYVKLTVKENLEHFGSLYGMSEAKRIKQIRELLELVGLSNARDVVAHNLSGGMQKRLDIACALIHEPKILILDEPTADLDPLLRKQMWALIQKINRKGTTVIVASHFVDEIGAFCQRIAILGNKHIRNIGTVEELVVRYAKNYELELETVNQDYSVLLKSISRLKGVERYVEKDESLVVYTSNPDRILVKIAQYCQAKKDKIKKLSLSKPSLSEVFESIVKQ